MRRRTILQAAAALVASASGCASPRRDDDRRVVFAHQPLWGDRAVFDAMLAGFAERDGGAPVVSLTLPNASDVAHQFFLTALEGESTDFDLMVIDVVWVAELARARWIADLTEFAPPATLRAELVDGAAASAIVDERTYAIPWYVDVGLLYRRVDLVAEAPRTFDDLERAVAAVRRADPSMLGYVFQGKQYEGLVCNAYEAIWGHGGETFATGDTSRLALDTPPAREALAHLRSLVERGTSPPAVLSMAEEESRRAFQDGRAVFMRNWPYAWVESQKPGSPVRGKVALSTLPSKSGDAGHGTLGGYLLAVNAHAPPARRALAVDLARHLTSHEAGLAFAETYGRNPARRSVFDDRRLARVAPATAEMRPVLERARPRPVTPYYPMLTDALQGELSAALSGIRSADEATRRAQSFADRLMGVRR